MTKLKATNNEKKRTICLFGTYESRFPRTITIKDAAIRNGYGVIECHVPYWELSREKKHFFSLGSIIRSVFQFTIICFSLFFKYLLIKDHDVIIVGYNGYFDMPLAKLLSKLRRKPLIFTPVFPLYETLVEDRKYVAKTSLKSKVIHKIDEVGCRLADFMIIETGEYLNYYHEEFAVPKEKIFKIPLGADETSYFPRNTPRGSSDQVKVLFYGKFIPLQGIRYIVEAAKLLESHKDIEFEVIGSGQLSEEIHSLATKLEVNNVSFIDWVEYANLPNHIHNADICLGIFGDTPKATRGIPIKVYETLAMKKPVITGDSPAAREVFADRSNAILCQMADAEALAESILLLKKDNLLRDKIAREGHKLYHDLFSSKRIAKDLEIFLNGCVKERIN